MGGGGRAGGGWLGSEGGARGGSGRPGGANGGSTGDGGVAGWLRTSSSTMAMSSVVELAASPPGASGGGSGEGKLGGGDRGGGGAAGEGGANGLNEATQQPVQSQSKPLLRTSQVKETLSSPHVCSRPQGQAQGSSASSSPAAAGSWQSSKPRTAAADAGTLLAGRATRCAWSLPWLAEALVGRAAGLLTEDAERA